MRVLLAPLFFAAALSSGCNRQGPPEGVRRAPLKPLVRPAVRVVPVSELRSAVRDSYRLRPDGRFLLAFGEITRLATGTPAPQGLPATAVFSEGRWMLRLGEANVGSLPELPDFPDYFALLVAHAKATNRQGPSVPAPKAGGEFLMPGLLGSLREAESAWAREGASPAAARAFARLAFQMPDRLELAPLIPARALALLAAVRARDSRAGLDEEVLLAHALGYTAHAERIARSLPADAPLRLFETLDDDALWRAASRPGASEDARYFSLRRATAQGNLPRWREARSRFFPNDGSPAVIATGLDLALPHQVEVSDKRELLAEALPRAVLRELAVCETERPDARPWEASEFDAKLTAAASAAKGHVWDGAILSAYYEAAYYACLEAGHWPGWATSGVAAKLMKMLKDKRGGTPGEAGDTTGAPLLIEKTRNRITDKQPAYPRQAVEIRALVPRLDARPAHRAELAKLLHSYLFDVRAAEDLQRSIARVSGDGSRRLRAEAALYLGDWDTLERLLRDPQAAAPEVADVLWRWYGARAGADRLDAAYVSAIQRFPHDWNLTNYYVDFLRDKEKYREACAIIERWLAGNPDPRTPGHFHAHIRLAHGYVLAKQYDKGLSLLDGMRESEAFQKVIIKRGRAECLAGLGKTGEAEVLMREAIRESPYDPDDRLDLARILWMAGKDKQAAEVLADPASGLNQWQTCKALTDDFPALFLDAARPRLDAAVDALAKQPALRNYYHCVTSGFTKAKRWEDAFRVATQFLPPGPERMDFMVMCYEFLKEARGREAAAEWLKGQIPAGQMNPLSMKALYTKNDDLLWDVIVTPDPGNHPEWVWLFRATAFTLRGGDADPHKADLLAYYGRENPDAYHVMGRYLLGLASEDEVMAVATAPQKRSEVAFYLGARAQREKRFRDACDWYRVSVETEEMTSPRMLALHTLGEWSSKGQGIWREKERP